MFFEGPCVVCHLCSLWEVFRPGLCLGMSVSVSRGCMKDVWICVFG